MRQGLLRGGFPWDSETFSASVHRRRDHYKTVPPDLAIFIHLSGDLTLGDLLVGVGTLALAGFTYRLAAFTRRQVEASGQEIAASREGLEVARESIEAADMPFVIPTTQPDTGGIVVDDAGRLLIRFWNLGRGPALVSDVQLEIGDRELLASLPGFIPIHPGGVSDQHLRLRRPLGELLANGDLDDHGILRVFYNHAAGTSYMTISAVSRLERTFVCRHFSRSLPDVDRRPLADLEQ